MKWYIMTALHSLYEHGKVKKFKTLTKDSTVKYLLEETQELEETPKTLIAPTSSSFYQTYEHDFLEDYKRHFLFLKQYDLLKPQTKHEKEDIEELIKLKEKVDRGELDYLTKQIKEADETRRGVSFMFFKNDKYLENRPSLEAAVKQILGVTEFAADKRDQQYLYKLQCEKPVKLIVLCENIHFLKMPKIPRTHHIELWFAGGYNIDKLQYADTRGIPIYYSCDWDNDGLKIFKTVKQQKGVENIKLLYPTGKPRNIAKANHTSKWNDRNNPNGLSGLDKTLFSDKEKRLISSLIKNNQWIVEESNKLLDMLNYNKCL